MAQRMAALLGISAYSAPPPSASLNLEADSVEEIRRAMGGQLAQLPTTQTRWYLEDVEDAEHAADGGDLSIAAQLMRSARKDGILAGVLSTRTGGLVRLPKRFRGRPDIVSVLELGHQYVRSIFDEMLPPTELALLAADGLLLGVGVAELVPVEGRDYPVLVRLDPEFLRYRWNENRWYYASVAGLLPITPGDGRWVLHTPGGRQAPWQNGLWRAIAKAYVRKEHACLCKDNWEQKLANPARVAVMPNAGSEGQKDAWFKAVMQWGINTVFGAPPGYDVKLVESNGRGWESFDATKASANEEMIIAVAGQTVTTDGGAGFQNSDIHKSIRADLIKDTADGLAYTVNTQALPPFIVERFGLDALEEPAVVEWDVTPPKDRNSEALSLGTTAQAITQLTEALSAHGLQLDASQLCARFAVPVKGDADGDGTPDQAEGKAAGLRLVPGAEDGEEDAA